MLLDLSKDYNLRAYAFEYIAKVLLRRQKGNNFIFNSFLFQGIDEIISRYRLHIPDNLSPLVSMLRQEWRRCDLIEFSLDNTNDRNVIDILCYDVKSKWHAVHRRYGSCISNAKFMNAYQSLGGQCFVISMVLFENWRISFNVYPYSEVRMREFTNFKGIIKVENGVD
jgi:hypothetical protein